MPIRTLWEDMDGDEIRPSADDARLRKRPALWRPVTVLCWVLVGLAALFMLVVQLTTDPLDYLDDPLESIRHVGDKSLDLDAAIRRAPDWERAIYAVLGYVPDTYTRAISDAYGRAIAHGERLDPEPVETAFPALPGPLHDKTDALRARRAILVAEAGEWERVGEILAGMSDLERSEAFVFAMAAAYPGQWPATNRADRVWGLSALGAETNESWAYDHLHMRIAGHSDPALASGYEARILERGRRTLNRGRIIEGVFAAVLVTGVIVLVRRRTSFRNGYELADGLTVAPWPLRYGLDVLARFIVSGAAVLFLALAVRDGLSVFSSLLAGLPMLILANRYLFAPSGLRLPAALGLRLDGISWRTLFLFTVALIAVDQGGALIITGVANALGFEAVLEEGIEETVLFGRPGMVALLAVDGIVSAPLMEEIGFRGLLYMTLRSRCRPLPAAIISALLFGVAHMYSLSGLLVLVWTGFILALAFERSRSLWPCVLAHSFNNLLYFADQVSICR